jgi:hypothetical protein
MTASRLERSLTTVDLTKSWPHGVNESWFNGAPVMIARRIRLGILSTCSRSQLDLGRYPLENSEWGLSKGTE